MTVAEIVIIISLYKVHIITGAPNDKFRWISVRWRIVRLRFSASMKECTSSGFSLLKRNLKDSQMNGKIRAPYVFGRVLFTVFGS